MKLPSWIRRAVLGALIGAFVGLVLEDLLIWILAIVGAVLGIATEENSI